MTDQDSSSVGRFDSRLSRLYAGEVDKQDTYDAWAGDYERDLVDDMGYVGHVDAARIFGDAVPNRNCRVLDVACGTGLVGAELARLGFGNIDGTDFSEGMLKKAREMGQYRHLFRHDFTREPGFGASYDALICVGLFAFDVPRVEHIVNVVQAVKPSSPCVITVNGAAWRALDYAARLEEEADRHGFSLESVHEADYIRQQGIDARVLVIRSPQPGNG